MSKVVQAARRFLGVPYHHQGRSEHGMDCAGLVVAAYAGCGVALVDLPAYGREPWRDGLRSCVEENFRLVDRERQPGDILLLRVRREPQHLAIVTDRGMIHSYASVGKVVETNLDAFWRDRIVGVYSR
jgi:cell wall-associated NlpC family hydrolase